MKRSTGFTLIELMIVVAIVGILAAIAYPSYIEHIKSGRRSEAKVALVDLASFMERYYTEKMTYAGAVLPYTVIPKGATGDAVYYTLAFKDPPAATYMIQVTPGGVQSGDRCGVMGIDNRGAKTSGGSDPCW